MIERYTRKEIKSIWEDKNKYSLWLEIELAAAEAMEKLKIIPNHRFLQGDQAPQKINS